MKSVHKVALGGMITALCLVLMLLTGVLPMAEYALPMMAGALLIVLVIEVGCGEALLVYLAIALLSLLLAPCKDSAVFFTVFLGWYPILKSRLERIRHPVLEWCWKLLLYNLSIAVGLAASIWLFRLDDYLEMLQLPMWAVIVGVFFVNGIFVIYDMALTRLVTTYLRWFRPKYLQKMMKK